MKNSEQRIYLHIGRHKSGTSSIQNFICNNRDLFNNYDLYYPKAGIRGIAHHDLAGLFRHSLVKSEIDKKNAIESALIEQLHEEIDQQEKDVLISSEDFQNSNPELIKAAFEGYEVIVLIYIRNQIDYVASAYAQKVWATNYCCSMEEYFNSSFNGDYLTFLKKWNLAFNGNVRVRKFSRESLHKKDIVADLFYCMLEKKDEKLLARLLEREHTDSSPSLTSELLSFKLLLNSSDVECDKVTRRRLCGVLNVLSLEKETPPVRVTSKIAQSCRENFEDLNRKLSVEYFDGQELFNLNRPVSEPYDISKDRFESLIRRVAKCDNSLLDLMSRYRERCHAFF